MNRALMDYLYSRQIALRNQVEAQRGMHIDGSKCKSCGLEPEVLRERRDNAAREALQKEIDAIMELVWNEHAG